MSFNHHILLVISKTVTETSQRLYKNINTNTMQETQEERIQPQGWEDPLEEEMGTHCRILAWKISWTEEPGGLQSMGL